MPQASHIRAVHSVIEGQKRAFLFEHKTAALLAKLFDDLLVLFRFDATGAVDEGSPGPDLASGFFQQFQLLPMEARDFFRSNAPAQIDPPAHHSRVGARSVN